MYMYNRITLLFVSDSLQPHGLQRARPSWPSPTPGVYSDSCPSSQWCHPAISPSVVPFSSCPKPFPASGSFQMSHLFTSGSQSTGVAASTSVLPMNTQDWSPLGWTGWFTLATLRMREIPGHWKADKLWIAYLQDFEHLSRNQPTPF